MPRPIANTSRAPLFMLDQWYFLVYGQSFFTPGGYWPDVERAALQRQYAGWLRDLKRYSAGRPGARRFDVIRAWAEIRGITLTDPSG